jgi:hypothetical protein
MKHIPTCILHTYNLHSSISSSVSSTHIFDRLPPSFLLVVHRFTTHWIWTTSACMYIAHFNRSHPNQVSTLFEINTSWRNSQVGRKSFENNGEKVSGFWKILYLRKYNNPDEFQCKRNRLVLIVFLDYIYIHLHSTCDRLYMYLQVSSFVRNICDIFAFLDNVMFHFLRGLG